VHGTAELTAKVVARLRCSFLTGCPSGDGGDLAVATTFTAERPVPGAHQVPADQPDPYRRGESSGLLARPSSWWR